MRCEERNCRATERSLGVKSPGPGDWLQQEWLRETKEGQRTGWAAGSRRVGEASEHPRGAVGWAVASALGIRGGSCCQDPSQSPLGGGRGTDRHTDNRCALDLLGSLPAAQGTKASIQ